MHRERVQTRRGPRRKPRDEVKNKYVQVGLTPKEKAALDKIADTRSTSGSAILRGLFIRMCKMRDIEI
jgi:hypothetical protein